MLRTVSHFLRGVGWSYRFQIIINRKLVGRQRRNSSSFAVVSWSHAAPFRSARYRELFNATSALRNARHAARSPATTKVDFAKAASADAESLSEMNFALSWRHEEMKTAVLLSNERAFYREECCWTKQLVTNQKPRQASEGRAKKKASGPGSTHANLFQTLHVSC